MTDAQWDVLRAKYTGSNDEYDKKKAKVASSFPDVDVGDGAEFVCEDLVVEGPPETLKPDLLPDGDSYVDSYVEVVHLLFVQRMILH